MHLNMVKDEDINEYLELIIPHPIFSEVLNKMVWAFKNSQNEPTCFSIVGDSGVGKTSLVREMQSNHQPRVTRERNIIPIIHASMRNSPTREDLLECLLENLHVDTSGVLNKHYLKALIKHIDHCRVGLIIIDEFQTMLRSDKKANIKVANLIKDIIDSTKCSLILMGMPDANKIFEIDNQLKTRFGQSCIIEKISLSDNGGVDYLQSFLKDFMEGFPAPTIDFSTDEMAYRMMLATGGCLREFRKIIYYAYSFAKTKDDKSITKQHYQFAYDHHCQKPEGIHIKPFTTQYKNVLMRLGVNHDSKL